jgi:hypothetical protein
MDLEQMQPFVNRRNHPNFAYEPQHHSDATVADRVNWLSKFIPNCVAADRAGGLRTRENRIALAFP